MKQAVRELGESGKASFSDVWGFDTLLQDSQDVYWEGNRVVLIEANELGEPELPVRVKVCWEFGFIVFHHYLESF